MKINNKDSIEFKCRENIIFVHSLSQYTICKYISITSIVIINFHY